MIGIPFGGTVAGNCGGVGYLYEEGELIPVRETRPEPVLIHNEQRQDSSPPEWVPPLERKEEPGLRYDAGKARYDLLPADALHSLVNVYTAGAAKYADRNWEKGMSWSRCFGSLMRHCWAFWRGETFDPESKCHHMAHAAWNALALVAYDLRGVGTDDRPKL